MSSEPLTPSQIREQDARMHGIGRQIKEKLKPRMKKIMNEPIMDIEDKVTQLIRERDEAKARVVMLQDLCDIVRVWLEETHAQPSWNDAGAVHIHGLLNIEKVSRP